MKNKRLYQETGFTLLEVIVVVVLIGILAVAVVPNIKSFLQNSTTRSVARALYSQFQRAKMEAVKRNENVAITFSTAGTHQYQLYVDNDGDRALDAGEQVLATVVLPDLNNLSNITFPGSSAGFNSRGRPYGGAGQVDVVNTHTGRTFSLTTSVAGYVHIQ